MHDSTQQIHDAEERIGTWWLKNFKCPRDINCSLSSSTQYFFFTQILEHLNVSHAYTPLSVGNIS